MSRLRLVVFDLDGTLVDSLRDLADSANALLTESGCLALPEPSIARMVGDGAAALIARAFEAAGAPQPADALARFLAIYDARLLEFTRPYPGVDEALDELGKRATLSVLTNKPIGATRRILAGLGLARHFAPERVMGGDGPFPRKPDPAGLRHLAAIDNVTMGETLLVGDSAIDCRTARAAGAWLCVARYGFGFGGLPRAELAPEDRIIDRPLELLSLL